MTSQKRSGTPRAVRATTALAVIALAGVGVVLARHNGFREAAVQVAGRIEAESVPVFSEAGGRVAEVLVHAGNKVEAGQLLLRMEPSGLDRRLGRSLRALKSAPAVQATANLLERVPLATWAQLARTDPAKIAAEREYVNALDEWQRAPSAAAQSRLSRAIAGRKSAYEGQVVYQGSTLTALREAGQADADLVRWLAGQRGRLEVRAPVDGVVELMDLSAGDSLAPMSPVALIDPDGRFTVKAQWAKGRPAPRPGVRVDVVFEGNRHSSGVVESNDAGGLRVSIVNPPVVPQPGGQVWILL